MEHGKGHVWLGLVRRRYPNCIINICLSMPESAELGAAGVHKSSYAQLSKTHELTQEMAIFKAR